MKDRMQVGNVEGQILEDVICLVFLEFYFVPFAPQYSEQKLAGIIRKTWRKMSERGKQTALTLAPLWPPELLGIVKKAVGIL